MSEWTRFARRSGPSRPTTSTDLRLPLPRMRSRLQHFHRYGVVENALRPIDDRDASARICEGGSNQASDRRDGLGLPVGAEASPPYSGSSRSGRAGWTSGGNFRRIAGSKGRSRRNVSRRNFCGCGGKNPIRTEIRMILPAVGPTNLEAGAPTKTTGLRSSAWSAR